MTLVSRAIFFRFVCLAVLIASLGVLAPAVGFARVGGADPTGGEGQRSSSEQLRANVEVQLAELPNAFFRLKMFLESPDASDQRAVADLGFLRGCFAKPSTCHGDVNSAIAGVRKNFRQTPNYVAGDCPSVTVAHDSTDMSLSTDLDLCVSEKLGRYPPREMRRQVFSLLAHEIVHGVGFGEPEAQALQNWFLENHAVVQPAASFRAKFDAMNAGPVAGLSMLARDLDYQPASAERLCIFAGELALNVHKLNDLYSSTDDEDALIGVPSYPIRQLGQQADRQVLEIVFPYCISKKPLGDGIDYLTKLKGLAKTLEGLRFYLDVYSHGSMNARPIDSVASAQATLRILVAEKDLTNSGAKAGNQLTCKVEGAGDDSEHVIGKHGEFIALGALEPGVKMKIKIEVARFRSGGALGVGTFPSAICEGGDCWGRYVVKVLSSNADRISDQVIPWNSHFPLKALGIEHQFQTVFQFLKRDSVGRSEAVGPVIKVVCEEKDVPTP